MTVATSRARVARPPRALEPALRARSAPAERRRRRACAPPGRRVASTSLIDGRARRELTQIHPGGVFEGVIEGAELPLRYQLEVDYGDAGKFTIDDPYAFLPTLGELDQHLIGEGRHEELYERLGAHVREHRRRDHRAPPSRCGRRRPARSASSATSTPGTAACTRCARSARPASGSCSSPASDAGAHYKYEILTQDHQILLKADPYALRDRGAAEDRVGRVPARAHLERGRRRLAGAPRGEQPPLGRPISIYEVHLGSWRLNSLEGNRSLTYLELADELAAYVEDLGFTHVELLPVMAHPFKGSWGYQVTGYYAPTPCYGSPDDFRQFVDRMHAARDRRDPRLGARRTSRATSSALARFDGTALYEHADPRRGEHPDWGTLVFNYGRHEVRNFLIANALFWLREYHADGIRVDAVASMLYLDYSRNDGRVGAQPVRRPRGPRRGLVPARSSTR